MKLEIKLNVNLLFKAKNEQADDGRNDQISEKVS